MAAGTVLRNTALSICASRKKGVKTFLSIAPISFGRHQEYIRMIIACNGMLRSGSTLQYNMVRLLVEAAGVGKSEGYYTAAELDDKKADLRSWGADARYHVIKLHDFYPDTARMVGEGVMKVCYIYRDIRDVAASAKRKWGHRGKALIEITDEAIDIYRKIRGMEGILVQRYEQVMAGKEEAVREISSYLGLKVSDNVIKNICEELSIENVKKFTDRGASLYKFIFLAKKIGLPVSVYDSKTLLHKSHISENRGAVGTWHNTLTADEVKSIVDRHRDWLKEEGYPVP